MKNNILKYFIILALVMMLMLTLAACDKKDQNSSDEPTPTPIVTTQEVEINFYLNDGSYDCNTRKYKKNAINTYTPRYQGHNFVGWSYDEDGEEPFSLNTALSHLVEEPNGDVIGYIDLYAQWEIQTFTITYRVNSTTFSTEIVEYGNYPHPPTAQDIAEYIPEGMKFIRWDSANEVVVNNKTIRAILEEDIFVTIQFINEGEVFTTRQGDIGEIIPLVPDLEVDDFVFVGWISDDGETFQNGTSRFRANAGKYTAKFELNPIAPPSYNGSTSINYGNSISLTAVPATPSSVEVYSYEWYYNDNPVPDSWLSANRLTVTKTTPEVGTHSFRLLVTASAYGKTSVNNKTINVTVNKAPLTISAEPMLLSYGDTIPTINDLTFTYDGFVYGDTASILNTSHVELQTNYVPGGSMDADYYVGFKGFSAENYDIKYLNSTIDITPRALNLFINQGEQEYNGTLLHFNEIRTNADNENIYLGDTISFSFDTKGSALGIYSSNNDGSTGINVETVITGTNGENKNACYSLTYVVSCEIVKGNINPSLVILPSGSDVENEYDSNYHTTFFNYLDWKTYYAIGEYDGVIPNEDYFDEFPQFNNAGEYKVNVKLVKENYNDYLTSYIYTITKAEITINVFAEDIIYGNASIFGFNIIGDTFDTIIYDSDVSFVTNYVVGSNVGQYNVTLNINEPNYPNFNIVSTETTFTVFAKTLTVELINNIDVVYGDSIPQSVLDSVLSVSGLIDGDINFINVTTTYTPGNSIGTYLNAIKTEGVNSNYLFTLPMKDVIVSKRDAVITIDSTDIVYGTTFNLTSCTYKNTIGVFGSDTFTLNYSTDYLATMTIEDSAIISATIISGADNYNLTINNGSISIAKRALTIQVNDANVEYGSSFDISTCQYSFVNSSLANDDTIALTYQTPYIIGDKVGQTISINSFLQTNEKTKNYDITLLAGNLNITPKTATLTHEKIKTYINDSSVYTYTFSNLVIEGLYSGDKISGAISTTSGIKKAYTSIGLSLSSDFVWSTNYNLENANADDVTNCYIINYNLNVKIDDQYIEYTVNDVIAEYDRIAKQGVVEVNEYAIVTYSIDNETFTSTNPSYIDAGEYTVFFKITQEDFTPTSGKFVIKINKRQASVSFTNLLITYGDAKPSINYTTSHFLSGDEELANIQKLCAYEQGSHVGSYAITASYSPIANYDITINSAILTVATKALTINPLIDINITYGDSVEQSLLNSMLSVSGFVNGDSNFVSISTSYKAGNQVGEYDIITSGINTNYSYTLPTSKIIVAKKNATLKANDINTIYGQLPIYSYTATGLYGSDIIEGIVYAGASNNVGIYTITPVVESVNYNFAIQTGTLIVSKATLTITMASKTITYGDDANLSANYSGFAYNENTSNLTGSLLISCTYLTAPAAGSFTISASGFTSSNYDITYVNGVLTVKKAILNATINNHAAITYGDPVPSDFSCTLTGFKYSDTASVVTINYTTKYTQGSNASSSGYDFNVANTSSAANYNLVIGSAKQLVVNKAVPNSPGSQNSITGYTYTGNTLTSYGFIPTGFRWVNPTEIASCAKTYYDAIYNPNSANYVDYPNTIAINVVLHKATPIISATDNASKNWTGSAFSFKSSIAASSTNLDLNGAVTYSCALLGATNQTDISTSYGGRYSVTIKSAESTNYIEVTKVVTFSINAVISGSNYYTVEDISGRSGDYILFGNAYVAGNITLSGTLTLPYDGSTNKNITTDREDANEKYYIDIEKASTYLKRTLTIKSGIFNITGTLNIGGVVNIPDQKGFQGSTSGNYAQVNVENGATIKISNGGTLDTYGYIKGEGNINVVSGGTLKMPFVVRDYRGGSSTYASYKTASPKVAPFNNYEMPNIQIFQTINSGAKVIGHCSLWANDEFHKADVNAIYTSDALLNLTSGYMTIKYTGTYNASATDKSIKYGSNVDAHVYGNLSVGSLKLSVTVFVLASVTVNTADLQLGLPYQYNLTFESGTSEIPNHFKLLPGSNVTIGSNATVNVSGDVIIYDGNWVDTAYAEHVYPSGMGPANLRVSGTLNVTGKMAGNITGIQSGARVILGSNASTSLTSNEGYGTRGSGLQSLSFTWNVTWTETQSSLKLNGATTATAGHTYTYNGSSWN